MSRRTPLAAGALALLILAAAPTAAKAPAEVEVRDLRTGETTELSGFNDPHVTALLELVGWPEPTGTQAPRGVSTGKLEHIVTLWWRYGEQMPAWVDRVYHSERSGVMWVQRRDQMSDSGSASWSRLEQPAALEIVLGEIGAPDDIPKASVAAPAPGPTSNEPRGDDPVLLDPRSFALGAGVAVLLATGLAVVTNRRRQRSVTASRNSRVSSAASS